MYRLIAFSWVLLGLARSARGWGQTGHEMVANIAYERLSKETQDAIKAILRGYNHTRDKDAGSPLAVVANWADRVKYTQTFHFTIPLHYIDVQDTSIAGGCPCEVPHSSSMTCRFVYSRDCVQDRCVAGAILNYTTLLNDRTKFLLRGSYYMDEELTRESLMFLVHFVGDVHQPLHSARRSDKGGNSFHVEFNQALNRPVLLRNGSHTHHWNLHSVWDDAIIERALKVLYDDSREHFESDLDVLIEKAQQTGELAKWLDCPYGGNKTCVSIWAEESLDDALTWAYRNVDGSEVVNGTVLDHAYYETRLPIVQRRIATAGVRLAATLQAIFDDDLASI
jgi:hypothetical protein